MSVTAIAPAFTIGFGAMVDLVEQDGVEAVAGRRDTDVVEHLVATMGLEGEPVEQELRDRLDREEVRGSPTPTSMPSKVTAAMAKRSGSTSASSGM